MAELYFPPTQNGLQKTLDAQLNVGVTSQMTLNNTTGVQNKPGVVVIDRIDTSGAEKSSAVREYISYTGVSGNNLTGLTRGLGGSTDQDHAVGAIVEFIPDVTVFQAINDVITTEHNTDGTHKANISLTTPKITTAIKDANGNEIIETPATASAVNQIKIINAATGNNPSIEASGDDTNINLYLKGKGTGRVKLYDGSSYIDPINTNGWVLSEDTWTYASATSFTISGVDRTAIFTKGTRIKLTQTTDKYFVVTSSSFSTNTTVNITGGSDYTLANAAITNPYYSYQANPQGYPTFFNWTPTWGKSGTPPNIGNGTIVGKMMVVGSAVYYYIKVTSGSTTTFGDAYYAYYFTGHPISSTDIVFTGMIIQSPSPYGRCVIGSQGTTGWLYYSASPYGFNASNPFTLVSGDTFYIAGWGSF